MLRSVWERVASFRRPDGPAPGDAPEVGDPAPERPRLGAGEPRVLLFLRHVGCAFGEQMLRDLRETARAFPDVQFVGIAHGEPDAATEWCEELGFTRVHVENAGGAAADEWCRDPEAENLRVFVDEDRELYAEWGLGLGGAGHLLDPRVLASMVRAHLDGARDRTPSGTRWQKAGLFAVDPDGTVRARHVADYAGDLPDTEVAATFLDTEPVQTAAEASFSRVTAADEPVETVPGSTDLLATEATPEPREVERAEPAVEPVTPEPRALEPGEPAIRPVAEPVVEPTADEGSTEDENEDEDEEPERERLRMGSD